FDEIIPMGSRYPTEKPVEVELSATRDQQTAVELVVGAVGAESNPMIEVRYEGGQTVFLAQANTTGEQVVVLNERDPIRVRLDPPAKAGETRLRARFSVDDQRRLRVTVIDIRMRRELMKDTIVAAFGGEANDRKSTEALTGDEPQFADRPIG